MIYEYFTYIIRQYFYQVFAHFCCIKTYAEILEKVSVFIFPSIPICMTAFFMFFSNMASFTLILNHLSSFVIYFGVFISFRIFSYHTCNIL